MDEVNYGAEEEAIQKESYIPNGGSSQDYIT